MSSIANDVSRLLRKAVDRPPYRFTPRSFQTRPDQNPPRHRDVDPLIKQEMKSPVVTRNVDPLSVFPYAALPQDFKNPKRPLGETPREVLQKILAAMQSLYVNGQWDCCSRGKDAENSVARLFESVLSRAYRTIGDVPGVHWRHHAGSRVEGGRKPDVILVPNGFETTERVPASAMYAYCEVKQDSSPSLDTAALIQMIELAGLVVTSQIGRRFYVCMSLCGRQLTLGCFIRGLYAFTQPFNIDDDPILFLHILLSLSAAERNSIWTGFGEKPNKGGLTYERPIDLNNDVVSYTKFPLFRAFGIAGKGTVASAVTYDHPDSQNELDGVLKECWVLEQWPDDIEINILLNTRIPAPVPKEDEEVLGNADTYKIFSRCEKPTPEVDWDSVNHLPGIPIATEWKVATHLMPKDLPHDADVWATKDSYVMEPDTTKNIMRRFRVMVNSKSMDLRYEPRKHIYVLSRTHGIPIQYFSCRQEFLNAFMGVLVAHYNGVRKGILHCDVSMDNVWIRIIARAVEKALPDVSCDDFVTRAGMLGDWGSGMDLLHTRSEGKLGAVTVR
ncbi:hypothetical protein L210DRAFT_646183 [Boletus edulis BED1]|uniref:Fungal-type protein kinase domain-containing protein n=1 Tax=Boletus edulis BED1 TaxID=1328754 RepID=A0AAD4G715_BOLED|nr:hypothetical protein L210DRAFT_646183 [Boletus edulis BED1]